MNIVMYILIGLMALIGGGSTIYIVISFVGILCQKIYCKIRDTLCKEGWKTRNCGQGFSMYGGYRYAG